VKEKIVISRPCYDTYEYENVVSVSQMMNVSLSKGYFCFNHFCKGSNIVRQREQGVAVARQSKADRILWIDSDMMVQGDSLLKLLEADKDIISGVAVAKQPPFSFIIARQNMENKLEPIKSLPQKRLFNDIDGFGFGFVLIKTSVFDKIEPPYFMMGEVIGEDYYFCQKAKAAGFDLWVDSECQLGHVGQYVYSIGDREVEEPLIVSPGGGVIH